MKNYLTRVVESIRFFANKYDDCIFVVSQHAAIDAIRRKKILFQAWAG